MKKYLYILSFCFLQCVLTGFAQNKPTSMSDTINLSEVTVLAERPFVQYKADRMIVSVEHSTLRFDRDKWRMYTHWQSKQNSLVRSTEPVPLN